MANTAAANVTNNDAQRVRAFLQALEMRNLAEAEAFLAPGAVMQFPDAPPMYRLSELVDWAKNRYHHVQKTFHAIDRVIKENHTLVFCHGELSVEWLDGSTFTGVRFIDRFELTDGLITRQDVWNDLALIRR
ncbi:nuclear transport factor 2 family protein [Vreelandella populi]|uniref:Nuclear transport factor 2 family protein n=1 Tax=Vreelandella populi TaxID=2498858 RepID=A0A3S0YZF6_9GAMM|nr:nuclear transport factor 2 family protein [Halomonas populi]RUR39508.1 nuclear transport factor 2 family protein [Halomonas populi]RUR46621.1 nuclear transport factor 2 family protein [Halomonas populi]